MATEGHILLMKYLRKVLLQDCVALKAAYPELDLWNEDIFQTLEFLSFSEKLLEIIGNHNYTETNLKGAAFKDVTEISQAVRFSHSYNVAEFKNLKSQLLRLEEQVKTSMINF